MRANLSINVTVDIADESAVKATAWRLIADEEGLKTGRDDFATLKTESLAGALSAILSSVYLADTLGEALTRVDGLSLSGLLVNASSVRLDTNAP